MNPVSEKYFGFASRRLWQGALIVLLIFLAYFPAARGGFIWDDDVYVTGNGLLTAPDGLKRIWFSLDSPSQYFPLTYTTFRLEYALWGLNPAGYHWVNILLHAANALLLWRLLKRLSVPGAWLAAAIFALHPVQVESVAWITERKNLLSLFFSLLAVRAWVDFFEDRPKRWWFYFLSLFFSALALFSKTTACTLPAALLLILWLKTKPIGWRRLAQVVPFLAMGVGMGLLTVWWERFHQGTQGAQFSFWPVERLLIASHAVWFYLGKLVWPANLTFSYPRWTIDAANPLAYGWLAGGLGLGVVIYFVRRFTGRGLEVAALFYVATLSPMLGFIMLYTFCFSFVADHYQYAASIGPIALAAAGMTKALGSFDKRKLFPGLVLGGTLLLVLGLLTWRQAGLYRDNITLWSDTLAKNENAWNAHIYVGNHLRDTGRLDEAMVHYRRAIQIYPYNPTAYNDYGLALWQRGRLDEAEREFQEAIRVEPNYHTAHFNHCILLLQRGKLDEADMEVGWLLLVAPKDPNSYNNYGRLLMLRGKLGEAEAELSIARQLDPNFIPARFIQAQIFIKRGQLNEAVQEYESALRLAPASAEGKTGLADTLCLLGRSDEAIPYYREVLQSSPANTEVRIRLGRALIETGDLPGAESEFDLVLRTSPKNAMAIDGLGYVLVMQGRLDEAKARFLESMQLDPKDAYPHLHYAVCLSGQRQAREAMTEYRKALALDDQLLMAYNNLAWMLAAHPDPQIRNGQEAVGLAERACQLTDDQQPFYLGTLAAAYAEAGRFKDAIATAEKARDLARKTGLENVAQRNEQLLELYRADRPYHEPADAN